MTEHVPPTANGVPVNPEVRVEPTDFNFRGVVLFGAALALSLILVAYVAWLLVEGLGRPTGSFEKPSPPPLADERRGPAERAWRERNDPVSGLPPRPRLEALDDASPTPAGPESVLRSPTHKEDDLSLAQEPYRRSVPIGRQIEDEEARLRKGPIPIEDAMIKAAERLNDDFHKDATLRASAGRPRTAPAEDDARQPSRSSSGRPPRGEAP
jgi:hypothetical protein